MTTALAPLPVQKFFTNNGIPAVGGKLFTYLAGTTTKTSTWKDSAGSSLNTNPINLDYRGEAQVWLDPTLSYKFVYAPSTDTDPPANPIWTIDNIVGPLSIATLTSVLIGSILYPQTTQEAAALVTPTIFVPTLQIDLERYGGGVGASAGTNDTALSRTISVVTQKGGGILVARDSGSYQFSAAASLPSGMVIQGDGYDTIWQYTGAGSFLTVPSTASGRVALRELQIKGTGRTGTGFTTGDGSGVAGWIDLYRVLFDNWATAFRMGGAVWLKASKCEFGNAKGNSLGVITNNVGIDFNYAAAGNYSALLTFEDCVVSNNANAGVQATSVPIITNVVNWIRTNVQNNCQSATGNPQFYMGPVIAFSIDGMYMEYILGGTAPDAIRADNLNNGAIRNFYINTAANGIKDRVGGTMNQVDIEDGAMVSIGTAAINCVNENDVVVRNLALGGGTVTLSGNGSSYLPLGSGLAGWPNNCNSFTPSLVGTGGGPVTYTTRLGVYSRTGNVVCFTLRIDTSALGGLTGGISITGLPVASQNNVGVGVIFEAIASGITPVGANNQFQAFLPNNSTTLTIYGGGSAAPANVTAAAMAAVTSIIVSGSYQV